MLVFCNKMRDVKHARLAEIFLEPVYSTGGSIQLVCLCLGHQDVLEMQVGILLIH